MTSITQLNYDVRDLNGSVLPNKTMSISLRTQQSTPKYLIHKAIVIQDRNKRQGTASCKTRSEVRGGGKKPWKQKGTGQARSGSSNSPLWKGGGVTFGPKPRVYDKKINLKEKQLALTTALSSIGSRIVVVENAFNELTTKKTKEFVLVLKKFVPLESDKRVLIITHETNNDLNLSVRNIPNVQLLYSNTLNLRDVLLAKYVLITEKALLQIDHTNK